MVRIAILDDYQRAALGCADWGALPAGCEPRVFDRPIVGADALVAALTEFEVIVAMRERTPFPATLLARLPHLRLLVTTGMRNLAIDMDAARAQGVTVCGTALLPYPAFEHAWALILALAKRIPAEDRAMHRGGWQTGLSAGLRGKCLGVLGLGKLGEQSARMGIAFGMRVVAWSEHLSVERARACGAERAERDALLGEADFITIHLVLGERTRGLIGRRELALMKPSAYLVNTSRGPIVDQQPLVEALREDRIAGAGIDVYDIEPLAVDHPLRGLDNAVLTGHTGYVMRENFEVAYRDAVEDIAAWRAGAPLRVLNAPPLAGVEHD